jgi:hypothetical protein
MSLSLPEPGPTLTDPADLLLQYLGFYRSEVLRKLAHLSDDECRAGAVGWSPLELLPTCAHGAPLAGVGVRGGNGRPLG